MLRYKRTTHKIHNFEILLEYEDENQDDDVFPSKSTGLTPWPSSFVLSNFICARQDIFKDKSVLELGSGVGLSGMIAHQFARKVLLTDKDDQVISLLKKNLSLNNIPENEKLCVSKLSWGVDVGKYVDQKFDIIIGSDIIYSTTSITQVLDTVDALLNCKEGALFILSYVSRDPVFDTALLETSEKRNYDVVSVKNDELSLYFTCIPHHDHVSQSSLRLYLFKRRTM